MRPALRSASRAMLASPNARRPVKRRPCALQAEAIRQAAEDAARKAAAEAEQAAQELALEAERKAARDARYAARKARRR